MKITAKSLKTLLERAHGELGTLKVPENIPPFGDVEFKIFEYLLRYPCQICSHDAIKNAVWGNREVNKSILSTHIERMNHKYLHTGWGRILNLNGCGYGWFPDLEGHEFKARD